MPRPPNFPGLQAKYEQALRKILANKPLSSRDIQLALKGRVAEFGISDQELADILSENFANYNTRAKMAGVIQSGGPWAGYQLSGMVPASSSETQSSIDEERPARRQREQREAAMHLVATCGLSIRYGSRVESLPKTVDAVAWGNADMLMLRGNPSRQRLEDSKLHADILKLADSSPECILSSVELKYDLERNPGPARINRQAAGLAL